MHDVEPTSHCNIDLMPLPLIFFLLMKFPHFFNINCGCKTGPDWDFRPVNLTLI